jgi:hypothetical protein
LENKNEDEDWKGEQVSTDRHIYLVELDLLELGDGDGEASAGSA